MLPVHAPTSEQVVFGQIGAGIGQSLMPSMQSFAFDRCGVHGFYRQLDIDELGLTAADLPRLLDACVLTGWRAIGITHPLKEAVVGLVDTLDDAAREMGSVNCVVVGEGGTLTGYNLDWRGAAAALEETLPDDDDDTMRSVAIVGAGGVARAVMYALLERGVRDLVVCDLVRDKAQQLAVDFAAVARRRGARVRAAADAEAALAEASGVVNCTEVGMAGHPGTAFDPALLHAERCGWLMDCVHTPSETELVIAARAKGMAVVTGDRMSILMWSLAFKLQTGGLEVPGGDAVMQEHFSRLMETAAAKL
jgi:shikimate dehydrogenase